MFVRTNKARLLKSWVPIALAAIAAAAPSLGAVIVEDQELMRAVPADGDRFGISVAISGDTAVVGAWQETNGGGTEAGAAYVFVRSGSLWTQQQKLVASDAADEDWFGWSVAIQGDTVFVGSVSDDYGGHTDAGSVYIFHRSGTSWSQVDKLTPSAPDSDDSFGSSIAIRGVTLLIGARSYDQTVTEAGAAYVFTRSGPNWIERAILVPSVLGHLQGFGGSLALVDNATALIGSCARNHSGYSWAGAVYVFVRSGTTWTEQTMLTASDPGDEYYFGSGLAVSGEKFITGAYGSNQGGVFQAGSAYIFLRDDNGTPGDPSDDLWNEEAKLTRSGAATSDLFGSDVALKGDVAVVGALWVDHSGLTNPGAAYVFEYDGTAWNEEDELIASDATDYDMFGIAVAFDGSTAVVGAELHDDGGLTNSGAAYVYGSLELKVPSPASEVPPDFSGSSSIE